ncbi:LysR family hydrogen peroxide-inducible transcriptional activator [Rhodoblastus acidophilus]|uniref:LysR substrate-binding domain-containing protein n=1 Tax=Rhodoblastus acidophilus TaxID=1074 RepID=UPI00222406A5|nr:LysR substrate-binding domain-containing protein [Rhodoblastus acidophilus]MCW2285098.1 LysR family hydrogen peroxide-inducible transcriptional activator [Rhodoblastus acidophilus]MCW2334044.1 LysR family hydrogen peroxide-inducible transcriptional activator [Rhodoblastus acidophilus]
MNIRDLEYLVALADKRNFSLAANVCNVSQPALSLQIKKLEDFLGVVLFERTPKCVTPTEDAAFIIANARLILEKTAEIRRYAHEITRGERPRLITLGVIPTIAPYYLPSFFESIARFDAQANIRWQILEDKTDALIAKLDRGAIDAAILVVPSAATLEHEHRLLFEEDLYLAVQSKRALACAEAIHPGEIEDDDWLLLDEGHCLNIPIIEACNKAGVGVDRNSFRATSLETLRHMVAHNSGVTLIPEMARRDNDGVAYIPIKSPQGYKRAISLVWRRNGLHAQLIGDIAAHLA